MRRASQVSPSTTLFPSSSSDSDSSSLSSWWGGSSTSLSTPCFSASSSATASPSSPHSALSSVILSCTLASALCADSASTLSSAWPVSSPLYPSIAAALQNATASSSSSLPASNSAQMNSHSQLNTFDGLTPFPHPHTADFSASSLKAAPFSSYPWLPPNSVVDGGKTALELESNEDIRVPSTASLNLFLPDSNTKPPRNDCLKVDNSADMMLPLLSQGNAMVSATPSASPRHQVQMLPFITPYDPTQSAHPSAATSRRPSLTAFTTSPNAAIRKFFPANPLQLAASANASLSHNQLLPALPMAAHTQLRPDATDRSPIPMVKAEPINATLAASHKRKHSHLQESAADDAEQHIPLLDEKTRQASSNTEGFAGDGEGEDDEDDEDEDDEDSGEEEDDKDKHGGKSAGAMANRFAADGLSCHQCKTRRTGAELLFCHHQKKKKSKKGGEKACRKKFCFRCIQKFYENLGSFEDLKRRELEYVCPGCRGDCSCASCRRSRTRKQMKALIKSQGFLPSQANQLVQSAFAMPNNAQGSQTGKRAKLLMPKGKKPKSSPLLMGAGSPLAASASTVPVFMPQYVLNQQQGHGAHFSSPNVVQVCPPLLAPTAQQCHSAFASAAPSPSSAGSSSHSTPLSSCSLSSSLSSPALTHPADRPSLSPALSVNSSSTASSAAASAVPSTLPSPAGSQAGNIPVSEVAYSAALSNLHGLTQELQTLISRQPELANQVFQMLQSQIKQHNERQTPPNLSNANAAFNSLQSAQYAQTAQAPMSYNAARAIANAATALLLQSNPPVHFPYPQQTHAVDSIVPLHMHSQSQSQSLTHAHSHTHTHSHSHSHPLAQSHVHMHASASALTAQSPLQSVSQPHSHGSSNISPAAYVCHPNPALQ